MALNKPLLINGESPDRATLSKQASAVQLQRLSEGAPASSRGMRQSDPRGNTRTGAEMTPAPGTSPGSQATVTHRERKRLVRNLKGMICYRDESDSISPQAVQALSKAISAHGRESSVVLCRVSARTSEVQTLPP